MDMQIIDTDGLTEKERITLRIVQGMLGDSLVESSDPLTILTEGLIKIINLHIRPEVRYTGCEVTSIFTKNLANIKAVPTAKPTKDNDHNQ